MQPKISSKVLRGTDFCTAFLLADRETPRAIDGTSSRKLSRLMLTCVALVSFALVGINSLQNQPPKRSQKLWIRGQHYDNVTSFLDKMALQLNSAEWNCPCKTIDTIAKRETKAHVVDFYFLREQGGPLHITNIDHYCTVLNDSTSFKGFYHSCNNILTHAFHSSGWDTTYLGNTLYMNSMRTGRLNPIAFMYDVCMSWTEGISQASSSFLISHFGMKEHEAIKLQKFVKGIQTALRTCEMNTKWPPPGRDLYASEANGEDLSLMKMQLAVAIEFNWTEYMALCAPSYCEHLKINSGAWILFTALAQMGGFISVAVFALRAIVWPAVCVAAGWPTGLTTASPRHRIDEELVTPEPSRYGRLRKSKSLVTF